MGYQLVDVDRRHEENPESFWVPPIEGRRKVPVGVLVKLIFEAPEGLHLKLPPDLHGVACACCGTKPEAHERASGERMWVEVTERKELEENVSFKGILKNRPALLTGSLAYGDMIEFGPEHIIDAARKEDQ